MKTPCNLAEAAAEISITVMVEQLIAGKLGAIGLEFGFGLPTPIPAEHFMLPLRSAVPREADPSTIDVLRKLYPDFDWNDPNVIRGWQESAWIDPDTGEVLWQVYPATCLDIDGGTIYADGQPHWTDILIVASNAESANNQRNVNSGRKPKWDWQAIEKFVFDRMDYHGEFSVDDPEWRGVADLEREIQVHFGGASGAGPSHSTLANVPAMVERWRKQKSPQ
jgi:hypothetical protein